MALVTLEDALSAATRARTLNETAEVTLRKSMASVTNTSRFDIFLSHSMKNAAVVLGAKKLLEDTGKRVYVDWIDDSGLDRSNVTPKTADILRRRMRQSDALFYLHSEESGSSKWMPWELGYFDGLSGNVAIFPLVKPGQVTFTGQEYLGLYPYADITRSTKGTREAFIHRKANDYVDFVSWKANTDKLRPAP